MDEEEFEAREDEFIERFGGRLPAGHSHEEEESAAGDEPELAFIEYIGADALLQGIEAHSDLQVTSEISAELGLDYVRGSLRANGAPLPRIPPLKFKGGLRYQRNALQIGGEFVAASKQDRLSINETPTDGYALFKAYTSYSFQSGPAVSTLTVRLDNVTNQLYRNHLSLIKDFVPEMGRNFKVVYGLKF